MTSAVMLLVVPRNWLKLKNMQMNTVKKNLLTIVIITLNTVTKVESINIVDEPDNVKLTERTHKKI